ncbi:uncharacterized protein LOC135386209 [Ornithodoros turicata]|uniref:uncharacterized protein LOC135386209 n=1 Tax=Ornithodoros turicata TaxID=34597 RepID=UPI003138CE3A
MSDRVHESEFVSEAETSQSDLGLEIENTSTGMTEDVDMDICENELVARLILHGTTKLHIPPTTMNKILKDVASIVELKMDQVKNKVCDRFERNSEDSGQSLKEGILSDLEQNMPFNSCRRNGELSSQHLQMKFFKEHFGYTEPVAISLRSDQKEHGTMHYVPLTVTMQRMLRDPSVTSQLEALNSRNDAGMSFSDFTDGSLFKDADISFSSNEIQLMLYQDSFEVVNPLGSAKQKHKILGVYFTLGNLKQHNRSKVDQLQLCLFCTEKLLKKFGHREVFGRLVAEVKQLVISGLSVDNKHYKFKLSFILGDNLGAHQIGGFLESFSGEYFCRFCLITRKEFHDCVTTSGEIRTPENYADCVAHLNDTGAANNKGVKFESLFNEVPGFHVCRGLPPCLGHDVLEGVISYDVAIFLRYFQSKGWFSVNLLNARLEKLRLQGHDAADRPPALKEGFKTLGGQAAQNWIFLRFLPVLLADIIDPTDEVWQLFLLLRDIVNLVCARKISQTQILYLNELIQLYLELITELFPRVTLKPKHHFLLHYPELILKYGPLIWLWTLRFESKHSYWQEFPIIS